MRQERISGVAKVRKMDDKNKVQEQAWGTEQQEYAVDVQQKHKILIVDDTAMNRLLLREMLGDQYEIEEASDGKEAIELLQENAMRFSLVLLDIMMPRADGFEVLMAMNHKHLLERIPVMIISSETHHSYIHRAYELGAIDYINRPFDASVVHHRVMNAIHLYARQKKLLALATDQIYEREKTGRLMTSILSHVVEQRNGESGLHVLHINVITRLMAQRLQQKTERYPMDEEAIEILCNAASIHDIGKIGISTTILNKPGRLTDEEYQIMKQHSALGADMIASVPQYQAEPLVQISYEVCRWHHERWDGGGYPDGLRGDEIPISAQIVAIADVYDALTGERVYKKAFSHEVAVQMILNGECGCFNPILLECFQEITEQLRYEMGRDDAQNDVQVQDATLRTLLQHEEIPRLKNAQRLLEYERTKLQFYNLTSNDIQFEQVIHPQMLTLSEPDAERLGLSIVTMNPVQDKKYKEIIGTENLRELIRQFRAATPEAPFMQLDCKLNIGGEKRWHRIIGRTMWEGTMPDCCVSIVGKAIDIHGKYTQMMDVQDLITQDALTGLLRWPYARKVIQQQLEAHPDQRFAAAIFDLDGFQSANNVHGHVFGDLVLKYVAERLRAVLPSDTVFSRIGGDEFLLFRQCQDNAVELIQHISSSLAVVYEGFQISTSVGLVLREAGSTVNSDELAHKAAQALCVGKRKGGGQYCIYDETLPELFLVLSPIESGFESIKTIK